MKFYAFFQHENNYVFNVILHVRQKKKIEHSQSTSIAWKYGKLKMSHILNGNVENAKKNIHNFLFAKCTEQIGIFTEFCILFAFFSSANNFRPRVSHSNFPCPPLRWANGWNSNLISLSIFVMFVHSMFPLFAFKLHKFISTWSRDSGNYATVYSNKSHNRNPLIQAINVVIFLFFRITFCEDIAEWASERATVHCKNLHKIYIECFGAENRN